MDIQIQVFLEIILQDTWWNQQADKGVMMDKLLPCPFCSKGACTTWNCKDKFNVECSAYLCQAKGAECNSEIGAIAAWNTRTDTSKDKLIAALRFYADPKNHEMNNITQVCDGIIVEIDNIGRDLGAIARAALKEFE